MLKQLCRKTLDRNHHRPADQLAYELYGLTDEEIAIV